MVKASRISQIGSECVACGYCASICPKNAIQIVWGIAARVDENKCIGCGKCAKVCPAAVIEMVERSVV